MNRALNIFIQFVLILLLSHSLLIAQNPISGHVPSKERGDPRVRTHTQLEGNQVRTSVFNYAFTGRANGNFPFNVQTPYEWPKNTGEVYLALTGIVLGGEVTDDKGVLQHIIEEPDYRTSPTGKSWNLEPIPGYSNSASNSLANSLDPSTWPSVWPDKLGDATDPGWKGSWNGYFGKNKFNADQELFAKASDDHYDRYANYFPDSTDLTRKGLGIIIDQRSLAWSQVLIQDDVFLLYTLRNDGTKDIPKMGVTIWFADFVGGNEEAQNNVADFDILGRLLWSRSPGNRSPSFGADPVGAVALFLLETPGNSVDRIDNDGDGETGGPKVTADMLVDEIPDNGIDDNHNGLIDENQTDIAFGTQLGTTFANGLDDNNNGEVGSPVVTQQMIDDAATDSYNGHQWHRWPPNPELDTMQNGQVWLIELQQTDLGKKFKDNVDNNGNSNSKTSYNNLPSITQDMINQAATDKYHRYKVPGTHVILYGLDSTYLGKRYLNKDGLRDSGVDEGIDEMIDESRTDGVDNDGDWNPLKDDVGLDGVPDTHDFGEGDGIPTSGVGTGEPGEPHIDLTDVKETDQIGITGADKIAAGTFTPLSDAEVWFDCMIPGKYFDPTKAQATGDYDLLVTSSLFPMKSGDVQPFSMAVILANGPVNDPDGSLRRQAILTKRSRADQTYQNNYQFAVAPTTPTLTAIPGDNKVSLYWDNIAEKSFDNFLANIGGDGHNFEGYRIYRASDPAFQDALNITNGAGSPQFMSPMAIFDLVDGIKGYDSLGIDGVHYQLGNDSGLEHSFVDTTVKNGFTYYYALVSYSKGAPYLGILPAESAIRINLHSDGSVTLGPNVARVVPEASSSGYVNSSLGTIKLIQGATSSTVGYEIVDPHVVKDLHDYYLTFQDTTIVTKGKPDTLTTKNYTLIDSTSKKILIYQNTKWAAIYEQPIIDGFRLTFNNAASVAIDTVNSRWNNNSDPKFIFEKFLNTNGQSGELRPNDYKVFFGNAGYDTSLPITYSNILFPSESVNFKVLNTTTNKFVKCGFLDLNKAANPGIFSSFGNKRDRIVFFEPNSQDSLVTTWWFYLAAGPDTVQYIPQPGDTAYIKLLKPFLSTDVFKFTSVPQHIDNSLAKIGLDNIKVVPNPYMGYAQWENKNPYTSGRGPRSLHFTHLPAQCTLRIFTADGELVQIIYHNSLIDDGTEDWNMLSKDNLSIAYGVYVLYVDAPGIGSKITKFAVIK
jgi:hypothetical protein